MSDLSPPRASHWMRDLLLLTVLVGLFYGLLLGSRALGVPDEARYSEIPREMVASGDYLTPRLNGIKYFEKPVLFYWLQAASIRLFGLSEWSLRLWTALFGLIGVLATYAAGRRLYGRRTGLIGAAVLATSLLYYAMAHIITLDMAVSTLLGGTLFAFLLGVREPPGTARRLLLWLFYLCAALAVLTKGLIGFVLPALVIGVWIIALWRWRLLLEMQLVSGLVLFLLVAAPWHILVSRANPEFAHFYFIHEHLERFLTTEHGRYQPPWYFIPILLTGLLPWTVFLLQALGTSLAEVWRNRQAHAETLFLLLWAGLIFLFFSFSDSKLTAYILPVFAPLAVLIGRYLDARWEAVMTRGLNIGYWALLIIGLGVAGALLVAPRYLPAPQPAGLTLYLALLLVTFPGIALAGFVLGRRRGLRAALPVMTAVTALFLVVFYAGVPLVVTKSVKDLAEQLRPLLRPGDEVVSYKTYLQDLPFYLRRRVTVVDELDEMAFGAGVEDVSGWMIKDDAFRQRWQSPATVYLLTKQETFKTLQSGADFHYHLLGQNTRFVLLVNHWPRS